jgi:hypothetical protein
MLKFALAFLVLAHGLGHVLFLAPTMRLAEWADQSGHSWLVTPSLGDSIARLLGSVAWITVIALFTSAVIGFFMATDWWRSAAIVGAALSIVTIVVFWDGIATSSAAFALTFDVIILIALMWAHWPGIELAGS